MSRAISDCELPQQTQVIGDKGPVQHRLKRYYIKDTVMPFEEDYTHEFKGHRSLSEEEVPSRCKLDVRAGRDRHSRTPVSRTINGFLNTGAGGTVYLGIVDNGTVKGMVLNQYQKDHIIVSLDDLMKRYKPAVEEHRYQLKFIPVVTKDETNIENIVNYDSRCTVDPITRRRPHTFMTENYCWCDKDALASIGNHIFPAQYVVEITVMPWDPTDKRNKHAVGKMKTHPMHQDELGKVYFRRQACVTQFSIQEITEVSKQTVLDYYQPQIDRLRKELYEMREKVHAKPAERNSPSLKNIEQ